jgi:hypothetical protein
VKANREHKSSVFTALFDAEDKVRELYAALTGVECDPETPIVITTLRDVLYMDRINDLSFVVEGRIVIIVEHQSSLNHNMPLRILLYIARIYEKIVDRRVISPFFDSGSAPAAMSQLHVSAFPACLSSG